MTSTTTSKNQKRSLIAALAMLVAIATGLACWYVATRPATKVSTHSTSTSEQATPVPSDSTPQPAAPQAAPAPVPTAGTPTDVSGVLAPVALSKVDDTVVTAFPELGVKLTLPSSLSDLVYTVDTSSPGQTILHLSSKSLMKAAGPNSSTTFCQTENNALGMLVKTTDAKVSKDIYKANNKKALNGAEFYYAPRPQGCTTDKAAQELEIAQIKVLSQTFPSINSTN